MKQIMTYTSCAPQDTEKFAGELAGLLKAGDVVLLYGDLGSGKTFLVKAVCKHWQCPDEPSSPTFTIINHYRGPLPVNHFDFYRLNSVEELDQLGWEEWINETSVTFIEWPQLIENQLDSYYKISIEMKDNCRHFILSKSGKNE
ncbi:MAG TPA: tRNA (adenosine(37)-N6)-threonylcarbamoyltransferase complex ATPase subunit type 1 TsaE [Caldithrix abyssi]|uniref:tRNA threonylcarbamoyladenosine biosynthesis protein TsaE n=1 Tax=Caldithrix abyssi TaxID=187145 RepID=A0A7V4WU56_CALAY|nr:tRNA (adenosine(37)-N6)-threonylcarbamoyltransferase complex ATPase subunit type 1 TsaE [Caldithrix abyssi]